MLGNVVRSYRVDRRLMVMAIELLAMTVMAIVRIIMMVIG